MTDYHVFLSYSRKNNVAAPDSQGWVTAFRNWLAVRHAKQTGRDLKIFFDQQEIASDEQWRSRILTGLRSSRLFIAFISPQWLASQYCRWELEEYLRLEHTLARGGEGVKQIYLVAVPDLETDAPPSDETWAHLVEDLRARQRAHGANFVDAYSEDGAALFEHLMRLDAEDRLAELRANPKPDVPDALIRFSRNLDEIDASISRRLDDAMFAEMAAAFGRLDRSYETFVGRADELRRLHAALTTDRIGLVGALHGLGGQGKTALAIQYAHAYAGFYACGGRWQIPCEGVKSLSAALSYLPEALIGPPDARPTPPEGMADRDREAWLVGAYKDRLKRHTHDRLALVLQQRNTLKDGHGSTISEHQPRMLLIFDNVDQPGLLDASALADLGSEAWLELVVTTRLSAEEVGARTALKAIEVGDLSQADAVSLLRSFRAADSTEDDAAVRRIAKDLAGFTLAIELVGAEMRERPRLGWTAMAKQLADDLTQVDALSSARAGTAAANEIRHREKQIGVILEGTLRSLPGQQQALARTAVAYGALMPPDLIVLDWLRELVAAEHPEVSADKGPDEDTAWDDVLTVLDRRRLLPRNLTVGETGLDTARMHRVLQAMAQVGERDGLAARQEAVLALAERLMERVEVEEAEDRFAPRPWLGALLPLVSGLAAGDTKARHRKSHIASTLSSRLTDLGRRDDALAAAQEAVVLNRALAQVYPASFTLNLATCLDNLGSRLADLGHRKDALVATEEAVALHRTLAKATPEFFTPYLASSLNSLGDRLSDLGLSEDALAVTEEAVALRRALARAEPEAYMPHLTQSLSRLGVRLSDLGRREEALAATEEVVALYRTLTKANPAAFTPGLAGSLSNLGVMLASSGHQENALAPTEEAVALRRALALADPAAFTEDLTQSLNNLGNRLSDLGRREEALAARQEAVARLRAMAQAYPAVFTPALVFACRSLGVNLRGLARREDAIAAFSEAIRLIRPFAQAHPAAFGELLAALEAEVEKTRSLDGGPQFRRKKPWWRFW